MGAYEDFRPSEKQLRALDIFVSDAMHIALGGGARSGKTFWIIRAIVFRALLAPGSRHGVFRFRFNALESSVIADTFPKVMTTCFPPGFYNEKAWSRKPGKYFYKLSNGSEIWFAGLGDKEQVEHVLGMEFVTLYFNECSQIPWHSVTIAKTRLAQKVSVPATDDHAAREMALKCFYDFNPPSKRHWTYLQFVDKKDPESKQPVRDPFSIAYLQMNPDDNRDNLSPDYLAFLDSLAPKARKRFLLGQFADDADGSLWTDNLLDQNRFLPGIANPMPKMVRIVISVDPSGCSGEEDTRSDEVGITVCALGTDQHGYLLEDLTGRYGPGEWGKMVAEAYERHSADMIVAEGNYGGAMVQEVIHAYNQDLPVKLVTATRGKVVRAEPISALYEQGRMHHVGYFPELEDQLCSFTTAGYQGLRSPDRADSAIWGFTELFPGIAQKAEENNWTPPAVKRRARSMSRYGGH